MLLSYHQRTQQYTACKKATLFYIEPNTFGLIFNYSWLVECDSTLLIYYPPKHLVTSLEKHPAVYPAAGCFSLAETHIVLLFAICFPSIYNNCDYYRAKNLFEDTD